MRNLVALALVALLVIGTPKPAEAVVQSPIKIEGAVTWKKSEGPYILDDTVLVPAGSKLSIEPGTSIIATSGLSVFAVNGVIDVFGTQEEPVSIVSSGMLFEFPNVGSGKVNIKFASIEGLNQAGLISVEPRVSHQLRLGVSFQMSDSDVSNLALQSGIPSSSFQNFSIERNFFSNSAGFSFERACCTESRGLRTTIRVTNNSFSGLVKSCGQSFHLQFIYPVAGVFENNSFLAELASNGSPQSIRVHDWWRGTYKRQVSLARNFWATPTGIPLAIKSSSSVFNKQVDTSNSAAMPHPNTPSTLRFMPETEALKSVKPNVGPSYLRATTYTYKWSIRELEVLISPDPMPKTPHVATAVRFETNNTYWSETPGALSQSKGGRKFSLSMRSTVAVEDVTAFIQGHCLPTVKIPTKFASCKEVRVFFPYGFRKTGSTTAGSLVRFDRGYHGSEKLDLDKDGLVCE